MSLLVLKLTIKALSVSGSVNNPLITGAISEGLSMSFCDLTCLIFLVFIFLIADSASETFLIIKLYASFALSLNVNIP